jgi:serine protease Do
MIKQIRIAVMGALITALSVGLVMAKPVSHKGGAWLGVYTQSVDDNIADGFKLPVKSGAIINEVVEDSPADQAGLMDNDIVVSIDGASVESADDLTMTVKNHSVGDVVTVKVIREGKDREFKVTLGERTGNTRNSDDEWSPNAPEAKTFRFFSEMSGGSYIGVELASLSDQLKGYFGVAGDNGVLVSSVERDTPAEKAGLKAGDVIVKANDKNVTGAEDLRDIISDLKQGDKVMLTVIRDRKGMTVAVEVAANEHGASNRRIERAFVMPDMGKIPSPHGMRMKGLYLGGEDQDHAMEDLRDDMQSLKDQIAALKQQIEELKSSKK